MGSDKELYNKKAVAKKIKESLMSQRKLAEMVGMGEVELSDKINGKRRFTEDELKKIEEALSIKLL